MNILQADNSISKTILREEALSVRPKIGTDFKCLIYSTRPTFAKCRQSERKRAWYERERNAGLDFKELRPSFFHQADGPSIMPEPLLSFDELINRYRLCYPWQSSTHLTFHLFCPHCPISQVRQGHVMSSGQGNVDKNDTYCFLGKKQKSST